MLTILLVLTACSGGTAAPTVTAVATPRSSASPVVPSVTPLATPRSTVSPPTATAPSASPSLPPLPGGRLVYGRFGPSGVTVYTVNPDGSDEQVLRQLDFDAGARWAPDGTKLTIAAMTPEGLIVSALVNPDGSGYVRFDSPDATLSIGCPAWSPNASRLACEAWDDTDPTRNGMYTVNASDGGDVTRLTTSPDGVHDGPGDYSPDGRQIVFTREQHNGPMIVNVDGSDERTLTDRMLFGGSWSPDGRTILADEDGMLWLVPVEGGAATPITIEGVTDGFVSRGAWSPDGDWIVFSLQVGPLGQASRASDLYIMRKDGTDLRQITDTPGQDEEFGDWGIAP